MKHDTSAMCWSLSYQVGIPKSVTMVNKSSAAVGRAREKLNNAIQQQATHHFGLLTLRHVYTGPTKKLGHVGAVFVQEPVCVGVRLLHGLAHIDHINLLLMVPVVHMTYACLGIPIH